MKTFKSILMIFIALAVAVGAWLVGYYTRKSNDNLPALSTLAQMDEAEVNDLLVGYRAIQLTEVWGEPDGELSDESTLSWPLGENAFLNVHVNAKGGIVVCSVSHVFTATVLEVHENYLLVSPASDSAEARSGDRIEVPVDSLGNLPALQQWDAVEITHSGEILETYPARLYAVYEVREIEVEAE